MKSNSRDRVTINQVADLAKVSIKTVSRVFNNEPNVRPATRDKVMAAAKTLHYRPNVSARRLAANRSFVLALVYDNPESDYVTAIQEGCLEICRNEGYHLLIHPCRPSDPNFVEDLASLYSHATVDGFILTQPVSENRELLDHLKELDVKLICISQHQIDPWPCVSVDDLKASEAMAEYLIELGHSRIGFITGNPDHGSSEDRLHGFKNALVQREVQQDADLFQQGLYNFESGYAAARRLLSLEKPPTAIFASNDHMALGVLSAAHEKGLRVPDELSICGWDDTKMARYVWPPLTTVRQPVKQVARVATKSLIDWLKREEHPRGQVTLHAELVRRASTGPIKAITENP